MKNSITISTKKLMAMCDLAGLVIDHDKSFSKEEAEEFMTSEYVLIDKKKVLDDDGAIYEGKTFHCAEYPEEGAIRLGLV